MLGRAYSLSNLVIITRANFLPLTIVIVSAGLAAGLYAHRIFKPVDALIVFIGATLTHVAVNVFNNYFDYRSGIDARTLKTPFSGGVEILAKGIMRPSAALAIGIASFLGAAVVGFYFLSRMFYTLLPILIYGLVAICLYTPALSKIHGLSEIIAGSGFGLMGLGAYVTQTGLIDATGIAVFVPVTILVGLLLFLNEFPDVEADKAGGRRHFVILLGKKRSAWAYVVCLAATYVSVLVAATIGAAPLTVLVSFATVPLAYKAGRIVLNSYERIPDLIPALGLNVLVILATITLMAVGFLVASL